MVMGHFGDLVSVVRTCSECRETIVLDIPATGYRAWQAGQFIQDALPSLSDDERELLISGVCGPCFDRLFAE